MKLVLLVASFAAAALAAFAERQPPRSPASFAEAGSRVVIVELVAAVASPAEARAGASTGQEGPRPRTELGPRRWQKGRKERARDLDALRARSLGDP